MTAKTYQNIRVYTRDVLPLNILRLFYQSRENRHCDLSDTLRFMLRDLHKQKIVEHLKGVLDAKKDN